MATTSATDTWSGLAQQFIQGLINNMGSQSQSGPGSDPTSAYPTYANPFGIGSGTAGIGGASNTASLSPAASNVGPIGAPNLGSIVQSVPLLGGSGAPVGDQSSNPTTGSQSYNPWDLKGQANVRSF